MSPAIGTRVPPESSEALDQYRRVEKIGEGGLGGGSKAHDTTLDRDVDRSTTPRWAWWPSVGLMACLALYFLACFHWALRADAPRWTALGVWSMFALEQRRHFEVRAFAEIDGVWTPVDLPALFPYRWESGYRWERNSFRRSRGRMGLLGASLCRRHPERPSRVRFEEVRWRKTLGSREQPKVRPKVVALREWSCSDPFPLPRGRSL